jgi:hypothetical protein
MLWALAGVLVAGASLALSKSSNRESAVPLPPLLASAAIPVVSPPQPEALLTRAEGPAAAPLEDEVEAFEPPRGASQGASVSAVRPVERPKNPPARRPELPF